MSEKIKAYVTHWWRSEGIVCVDGEVYDGTGLKYSMPDCMSGCPVVVRKPNWWETKADAIERVKECIGNEIISLEKKLNKLKKLDPATLIKEDE